MHCSGLGNIGYRCDDRCDSIQEIDVLTFILDHADIALGGVLVLFDLKPLPLDLNGIPVSLAI